MTKPSKKPARRSAPAVAAFPVAAIPDRLELVISIPGVEAALVEVVKFAIAKAQREEGRESTMTGDDVLATERLRLEAERNDLTRAELAQRVREWELDAEERRLRLEERKLELDARRAELAARKSAGTAHRYEGADHE